VSIVVHPFETSRLCLSEPLSLSLSVRACARARARAFHSFPLGVVIFLLSPGGGKETGEVRQYDDDMGRPLQMLPRFDAGCQVEQQERGGEAIHTETHHQKVGCAGHLDG